MVKIHNVKFYKPAPNAIYCMSLQKYERKLALSRSDSSIEIWNLIDSPYIQKIIPNISNYSVQGLVWGNNRLFSCTLQGFLQEYNLKTLGLKSQQSLVGEAGYCLDVNRDSKNIVVGTETGYLNVFDITEEDEIKFVKFLDKQDGKILCVKYGRTGRFIASAGIDAVRIWDVNTGNALHKMTTGRNEINKPTIVWCLEVTKDFTVITGDSRGKLTFWDGKIGAQIESYQSHKADILSLTLSEDENTVFCAGVDPILISYVKVKIKEQNERWVKSVQRKIHDHDVRALVLFNEKLYSGGIDSYLTCSYHPPKTVLKYPPLLQNNRISLSKSEVMLLQYQNYLELWSLGTSAGVVSDNGKFQIHNNPKKLLHLARTAKTDDKEVYKESIICSSISSCGKWIVSSTPTCYRLYKLDYDGDRKVQIERIKTLPAECEVSTRVVFSPDSKELIMASCSGNLIILNLNKLSLSQKIEKVFSDTILHLLVSPDGKYLVAGDTESNINVYLKGPKTWWFSHKLPKYRAAPTALAIQPTTNNLWISYPDHKIVEYSLDQKKFTEFSRTLDPKAIEKFINKHFPIKNITFCLTNSNIILLHDDSNVVVINKNKVPSEETPTKKAKITEKSDQRPKRTINSFNSFKKYKHLVHLETLSEDEFVAVEVSPLSLMEQLPPCLKQNTFGTK